MTKEDAGMKMASRLISIWLLVAGISFAVLPYAAAEPISPRSTLAVVRKRGYVICGASQGTAGFGLPDSHGYWRGLDVDTCRAVAAAVFGDKNKAEFVPISGEERLTALQTGEIDVLTHTTTWTLSRDSDGVIFTTPNFFDYTGFMVRNSAGVQNVVGLKGASVCVETGSTTEDILADVSRQHHLGIQPVIFDNVQATRQAFFSGRCDALITDASALASVRATESTDPRMYVIFPANNQIEALSPAVREGDDQWLDVVKWSFQALLNAEQLGITKENVDSLLKSKVPQTQYFLGVQPGAGKSLGLNRYWAYYIIKELGNYAEIYDRDVGKDSPLRIPRGMNRLARDGGLMVPLPFN